MSILWKSVLGRAVGGVTATCVAGGRIAALRASSATALALLLNAGLLCAPPAQGAFPGTNGALAYDVSNGDGISHLASSYLTGAPYGTPLAATGVDLGGDSFAPAWAPNGRSLAFASTRTGNTQIYSVQLSPTGQLLSAMSPGLAGQPPSVCGLEVCRLTNDPWADSHPSWSPSGQQLVFDSDRTGTGRKQICTMSASGAEVRCLACDAADNAQPAWSSSGLIAFQSNRSGSPQIYTMNAAGGEIRQVTNQPGVNSQPSWSPDGSELAYTSGVPPHTQIFTIALAGGPPVQLTHDAQGDDELPAWSPDGSEILVSYREPASNTGYTYAVQASSGSPVPHSAIAGFEGDWAPLPPPASSAAAPSESPSPGGAASPVAGKTMIASPLSGKVTVEPGKTLTPNGSSAPEPGRTAPPGGSTTEPGHAEAGLPETGSPLTGLTMHTTRPTPLRGPVEIPVDSTYNATAGVVKLELTTVSSAKPSAASAVVAGGRFSVTQPRANATPTLQLLSQPRGCGHGHGPASVASRHARSRIGMKTKNNFHAKGNDGKAGAGGTYWEIENTCQGTVYRAIEDDVTVTDPGRHRTIVLTPGHSYLVRPYHRRPNSSARR